MTHETKAPQFRAWLDRFFESYYRHRPVNATFIGLPDADDHLPDFSANGVESLLAEMTSLREGLARLPEESLSPSESIDRDLADGFLEIQIWELSSGHFHVRNPSTYTGEAIFGIFSLLLRDSACTDAITPRLECIPELLESGRRNVNRVPAGWLERAIGECQGAAKFFAQDLDVLHTPAAKKAAQAFEDFRAFLESDAARDSSEQVGCGDEAFDLMLRRGHFFEDSADDLLERAEDAAERAEASLVSGARQFGTGSWREALKGLEELHPSRETYYQRFDQLWNESRALAESQKLVTWPDHPVRYVPRPEWARAAAPHLYFLFYRSPAPLDVESPHDYLLAPLTRDMSDDDAASLLRATNDSVIKLNHVVHHGGIGHHIQNWHAARAESRIGRVAAVDCASRIAFFCGATMAEGWACYATDLMDEAGFLTALESYSQHHAHLRMAARAIVDIKLHRGEIGFDQAVELYATRTSMSPRAARSETVKNSMFPGAALIYHEGARRIHALRSELQAHGSSSFSLREFHDRFLSFGSLPVAKISAAMLPR